MKIFSWVHRRFNNKAEHVKRNGDNNNIKECEEEEEHYFPAEDKCDDVFERCGGGRGILTIGTFGYHPFKDQNYHPQNLINAYFSDKDDDYDDDDDSEKDDQLYDDNGDDDDEEEEDNPLVFSTYSTFNAEMEENWSHGDELKFGFEYVMMKKKERITLADLFCADSDNNHGTNSNSNSNTNTKKQNAALNKSDFVKDKSNRKQGSKDARPIHHKLNRLMRRMLKRKIHPDVGPTNPAVNNTIKCRSTTTDDYASLLLPTQDAS